MDRANLTQPALIGGLVMGVLSALPVVSAGNLCCCLWVVSGGVVAAYLFQQAEPAAITPGDGALVGLLAGVFGAFVDLILSIPITFLIAPMQRELLQRLMQRANGMPPQLRAYVGGYIGGAIGIVFNFAFILVAGVIFSTLGGLLGAAIFRRSPSPPTVASLPPTA